MSIIKKSIIKKARKKFLEFQQADRKAYWLWDQWRWRYFTFRHRKQAKLNVIFDSEHGIETAAEVPLETMGVPRTDTVRGNTVYRPLTESVFRAAVTAIGVDVEKYTFVDIGSGKGKVLFMAADLPFKRIIGIEYAVGLHEVAIRNVKTYRSNTQKCNAIEPIHADALEYQLPDGPLVLFIVNALEKATMGRLLQKWDRDAALKPDRPVLVIYTNLRTVSEVGKVFSGLQQLRIVRRMRKFVILANAAGGALAG